MYRRRDVEVADYEAASQYRGKKMKLYRKLGIPKTDAGCILAVIGRSSS